MAVDQITHHQLFAVVEEYVSMVFVNVTNDQAPKKWFTVNIVSVIISHANDIKGWCVVDWNMVDVLVEYASASKAGWAQTVRAQNHLTHAFLQVVKFAQAMASVYAVHANVKERMEINTLEDTVRNKTTKWRFKCSKTIALANE